MRFFLEIEMTRPFDKDHPEQISYDSTCSMWLTEGTNSREKYAYRDGHHAGWIAAAMATQNLIAGEKAVLLGLLTDCAAVIKTIEGEDDWVHEKLNSLLAAIDRAVEPSRHKGALL
jgi:hypothetical protein